MSALRLILADDHELVRSGFHLLLAQLDGIRVVAETRDGEGALRLVEALQPDIALLDISMPGLSGIDATSRISRMWPRTRVMILSMHAREEYVARALLAGAAGYLLKDATPAELDTALRAVARGQTYLSPGVSRAVVERFLRSEGPASSPVDLLTPRQREILRLIAEGRSTKQIAAALEVSIKTIETHRALLMKRLDVHDLAGLIRLAVREGVVPADR